MKNLIIIVLSLTLGAPSAFAAYGDIAISGKSATYLFNQLASRAEGVSKSAGKSPLGSRVEYSALYNLLQCSLKHGWVMETFSCHFPETDSDDIAGVKVLSGGGQTSDAIEEVSAAVNKTAILPITGVSASRLFNKLVQLDGKDKTFYKKEGVTRFLKNKFVGVGIAELYCQQTIGKVLGDNYSCVVLNTTVADSNARTQVVTDQPLQPKYHR
jgi:hypothetical protein